MFGRMRNGFSSILPGSRKKQLAGDDGLPSSEIDLDDGSPEATAVRNVRLFCLSGNALNATGDSVDVVHLPPIFEAAESSPTAAAAAARQVYQLIKPRKNPLPSRVQYNAVMLIQLLSDHPGASFTCNFDERFIRAVQELLHEGRDVSVGQILQNTLVSLEEKKMNLPRVKELVGMWRNDRASQRPQRPEGRQRPQIPQGASSRRQLPPPGELASRVEEARNTAKLLLQVVNSNSPDEVLENKLAKEFAERCQAAHESMNGYMNCDDPPPDVDTMVTLIDTTETLSIAMSRYHRCVVNARKATRMTPSPNPEARGARDNSQDGTEHNVQNGTSAFASAPVVPGVASSSQSLFASSTPPNDAKAFANGNENHQTSVVHDFATKTSPPPPSNNPFDDPRNMISAPESHGSSGDPVQPAYLPVVPPSQTFSIDSEPSYPTHAPATYQDMPKHDASELDGAQSVSPQRAAYRNSGATPSYIGRQASAANELTMHGAGVAVDDLPEMDGHSGVGRTELSRDDADSAYSASPTQTTRRV